jgi:hypothetical protein
MPRYSAMSFIETGLLEDAFALSVVFFIADVFGLTGVNRFFAE